MSKLIDISGKKFGRWTVISYAGHGHWNCVCQCGVNKVVSGSNLKRRVTKSCGCWNLECLRKPKKHGLSHTRAYYVWYGMIRRCYDESSTGYHNYGGRGIGVCDRWRGSVEAFVEDMGDAPKGTTLERKNNDLDYSPENCIWATREEQANNRRTNRTITWMGKTLSVAQWSRKTGIAKNTLIYRLNSGWSTWEVFNIPISGLCNGFSK